MNHEGNSGDSWPIAVFCCFSMRAQAASTLSGQPSQCSSGWTFKIAQRKPGTPQHLWESRLHSPSPAPPALFCLLGLPHVAPSPFGLHVSPGLPQSTPKSRKYLKCPQTLQICGLHTCCIRDTWVLVKCRFTSLIPSCLVDIGTLSL